MEQTTQILTHIAAYVGKLDWPYILTVIVLSFCINGYHLKQTQYSGKRKRTRYRVLVIGILYALFRGFVNEYRLRDIEVLLQSFIFAMAFHKLIIEAFLYWMVKHGLPDHLSKLFFDAEQLKRINHVE